MRNATRHDKVSTSAPPMTGPRMVVAADAPAQRPNARPCASPVNVAVRSASEPGTSSAPAAPCRTRKAMRSSIDGATPHSRLVTRNPARPKANMRLRPKKSLSAPASTSSAESVSK